MVYSRKLDKMAYYLVEHGWSERWIVRVNYDFADEFVPVNDFVIDDRAAELCISLADFDPRYAHMKPDEEDVP